MRPTTAIHATFSLLASLALLAAGCAGRPATGGLPYTPLTSLQPLHLAAGERLQVVATTSLLADVVVQVAGGAADVISLIPAGVDPHTFELAPQDLARLAQADVVFMNGFGLEASLLEALQNAGGQAPLIFTSQGIEALTLQELTSPDETERAPEPVQPGAEDPHVWLDPNNVVVWTQNIETALAALDPGREAEYAANASRYEAELHALDAEIEQALAPLAPSDRLLVTDHDEFGYFARRYGFTIVGVVIPGFSSAAETSAEDLAALEDTARRTGVRAVFVSATVNRSLAQRVADDTGIRLVTLYAESLTPPDGPAPDYLSLMRYNVQTIVSALQP
jgi:ABC-type Zn uptake system ZnuABC Zn-binding protein ZnuA